MPGQQAQTVDVPKRFPLVVTPANRQEDTNKDAKLINAYVEHSKETDEFWVYKRPGTSVYSSVTAAAGRGAYNWRGDIYTVFGSTLYKNASSIATGLNTAGGIYTFSQTSGATPKLLLNNGVVAYSYNLASGLLTLAGANFPTTPVKGLVYLDGKVYIMDTDSVIYGTNGLDTPDDWTDATNRLTAQIEPDGGVMLAKQLVYVIAIGQWSTEVFHDAQNPAGQSPLSPVQGAKINYGCVNADSFQEIDGNLFWIATNRSSAAQVVMVQNLKPEIVSTKPIERLLGEASFTNIHSFGIKYEGHRFYGVTLIDEDITLVYDMTDQMWSQWTDTDGTHFKVCSNTYLDGTGRVMQHMTNGKTYLFDSTYTNDNGDTITVDIITPNFDGGTRRRKHLNMMEFIADQTAGSVLQVRANDWDYQADRWTTFRKVDLGVRRPILMNNSTFNRRALHLRHQSDTRLRLQAIEMQLDLGTL